MMFVRARSLVAVVHRMLPALSTGGKSACRGAGARGNAGAVSRAVVVPEQLTTMPFRGAAAVAKGLLSRRQLAGHTWLRLFPDIYVWAGVPLDHRTRCRAAGLFLDGRGAISGLDAAALWGADATRRGAPIEAVVPDPVRVRACEGLRVVRSPLPPGDYRETPTFSVTVPARTAFDVARRHGAEDWMTAVACLDAMLAAGLVTKDGVAAFAAARKGWPGVGRVGPVLALGDGRAESPQESRLRLTLLAGGLPRPAVQHEVRRGGRVVARLDLAYPGHRLGVEYDGDHHRGRGVYRNDLRRLNDLRTCGWTVLRFTAGDLRSPGRVVATVREVLGTASPR